MNCIILFSAPAAGKGTISEYIKKKYNIDHISASDVLRDGEKESSEYKKKITDALDHGTFVDDDILLDLLRKKLVNQKQDFILDGTPRTINQANKIGILLDELNICLSKVIYINVDRTVAEDRILNRLICTSCDSVYNKKIDDITNNKCEKCGNELSTRKDDSLEVYDFRYKTFVEKTKPLINYYKDKNLLYVVNNNSTIIDAYNQIDDILRR